MATPLRSLVQPKNLIKLCCFIALLASGQALQAQSTYPASSYLSVGDSLLFSQALGVTFDFEATAAGITWDFTDLQPQAQFSETYNSPAGSPYQALWCLTNSYFTNCNSQWNAATNRTRVLLDNSFSLGDNLDSLNLAGIGLSEVAAFESLTDNALVTNLLGITLGVEDTEIRECVYKPQDLENYFVEKKFSESSGLQTNSRT